MQYAVIPSIKIPRYTTEWDFSNPAYGLVMKKVAANPGEFSKMQAAMFGGIVKDAGGKLIPLAYPTPKPASYQMDMPSVAANLTADLNRNIDESSDVVRDDLLEAQKWMNEGTEFGEAWLAYTGGNAEQARMAIRLHFDKLRAGWANGSEFFGKTPKKIVRKLLADQYERGLWASAFAELYGEQFELIPGASTEEKLNEAEYGSWFMSGIENMPPG